jgi:hypothetical protein
MTGQFENELKANEELIKLREDQGNKICPAVQGVCETERCMSFYPRKIFTKFNDGSINIIIPGCYSPLVNGSIQHEGCN